MIKIEDIKVEFLGLYPMGSSNIFQRNALTTQANAVKKMESTRSQSGIFLIPSTI